MDDRVREGRVFWRGGIIEPSSIQSYSNKSACQQTFGQLLSTAGKRKIQRLIALFEVQSTFANSLLSNFSI